MKKRNGHIVNVDNILKKKLLFLILVPILIAGILFFLADREAAGTGPEEGGADAESRQEGASGTMRPEGMDDEVRQEGAPGALPPEDAAGVSRIAETEKADAPENGKDKDPGDLEDLEDPEDGTGSNAAAAFPYYKDVIGLSSALITDPIQRIAFTDGSGNGFCRTIPVQIDASVLGGTAGTKCWALFLPSEMTAHPHIFFYPYEKVIFTPLQTPAGGGSMDTVESTAAADRSAGSADRTLAAAAPGGFVENPTGSAASPGRAEYVSGDAVTDLTDGSAFRVQMVSAGKDPQETDLYVFSCTGMATMYLDTRSGSMEAIDADHTKQTSEDAQFLICRPDGTTDSGGSCKISGHGNSSWGRPKRPYNLNLTEKQSLLGMSQCKKLCLLANAFDQTNLLDRISSLIADELHMRDTPQGEFVNLYLNGQYNGLYYLSQRARTGGSVHLQKLDKKILQANGQDKVSDVQLPQRIALHEDGSRLKKWAYHWANEPKNNTGGYLLQQYSRYSGTDCWFSTNHRRFRIMSPSWPTTGEVNYLQDYMLQAENAIYSEDGKNSDTGKTYADYLDMPSWEDMFLLEEYFAEWDAERWSFYITKDRDDPLLYCGPMWDFDHAAGSMIYGNYPETAVSMLMFRDTRHGWMHALLRHGEFLDELRTRWKERFSPLLHTFLDENLGKETAAIKSAAYMNNTRRGNETDFDTDAAALHTWLTRRLAFLDDYVDNADNYCRVTFQFSWGDLSHYVLRGETLGYLPLPQYGETQVPTQIEKNEIIGWQDEDGNPISADIRIDTERSFTPVYRQE